MQFEPCNECKLGAGGFGAVFAAQLRAYGSGFVPVAVKILDVQALSDIDIAAFQHEIVSQFTCAGHPHILPVRGAVVEHERGRYALIAERAVGNLHDVVHNERPLPDGSRWAELGLVQRLRKLLGVASAVAFMHEMGVVHNDIKPANILLDATGALQLTDFGLARTLATVQTMRASGGHSQLLTSVGTQEVSEDERVGGTWTYMAPERFEDGRASREGDVYSLAIVISEALTMVKRPFYATKAEAHTFVVEKRQRPKFTAACRRDLEAVGLAALPEILARAWDEDEEKRSTARQLHDELLAMAAKAI